MRRVKICSTFFVMAAMLAGCMAELGDEWDGESVADEESAIPDDEKGSIVDKTYVGDLGVALGSPVATGSTGGLSDAYRPSCVSNSSAPDATYTWTAPSAGSFVFDTFGSGFDTVLEIRRYADNQSLGCNDDTSGLQSKVTVSLSAGQTVLVVIDGYGSGTGAYRLNITGSSGGGGTIPSGAHLWLRADAEVSAPGGRVAEWRDQSGNGRHAYMPTLSRQPFLVNGALAGRPVVRFNGAQSLILSIYAQPTVFTVFIVGKNSKASESYSMILGPAGNAPNNQLRWENGSQALFVGLGNNMPIITTSMGNTRTYHALSARYNGSSMSVYRDGNQVSSHSFTTTGPWTLAAVGAWFSQYFMEGDLAEVIIYDRVLSDADRNAVNAYLRSKYGLP